MQQIERWGVIALVFLLVTIVAISFWGDSKSPNFWSRLTGGSKKEQVEKKLDAPPSISDRAVDPNLPLSPAGAAPTSSAAPTAGAAHAAGANDVAAQGPANALPAQTPIQPLGGSPSLAQQGQQQGQQQPQAGASGSSAQVPPAKSPAGSPLAASSPAPNAKASATVEYEVQRGDSLARIAARKLGSEQRWTEIQELNNGLDPRALVPGMKIRLPATASRAPAEVAASSTTPAAKAAKQAPVKQAPAKEAPVKEAAPAKSARVYVVQKGDHLTTIAARELGDSKRWKDIAAANPGLDANKLSVGQKITLPAAAAERAPMVASLSAAAGKPRVR